MLFIWDAATRLINLDKHGMDFADIEYGFDWENAVITPAKEGRFKAIGTLRDGAVVVIFATLGSEAVSIVSLRPASRRERRS
jgi:uncharacterized DUF497 family protein